ncbi:50S ribosomal protein L5 [Patescibacteria group bacterium]|nr:50S ribosomal protein L5 [Patescibacteria group bacterium]
MKENHKTIKDLWQAAWLVLQKEFSLQNIMQMPRLQKVVLNIGLGKVLSDTKQQENAFKTLQRISGQKPVFTKAKKSISNFKIREGMVVGVSVTLRGQRMYDFLDRFVNITLPRVRDFRGLSKKIIDQQGNLTIGFKEHVVFPEIRSDEIEALHGLEVTVVTSGRARDLTLRLFELLGFPFSK